MSDSRPVPAGRLTSKKRYNRSQAGASDLALPIRDIVATLINRIDAPEKARLGKLPIAWADMVGAVNAQHCRPGRFENGILYISVDNSVWMHELQRQHGAKILAVVRARFPEIRGLKWQLDPGFKRGAAPG